MTLTEFSKVIFYLLRGLITLATLPEAQHPFWIEGSLTRQSTIATDDFIEVITSNEVIIHVTSHLTPDTQLTAFLLTTGLSYTQATITLSAIGQPFNTQLILHALAYLGGKLISIRIPSCTPTLRHHLLTINIHFDISCIIEDELIVDSLACTLAAAFRFNETLINHIGSLQIETLRQILDTAIICLQRNFRLRRCSIFIIDTILITHEFLTIAIDIGPCQMSFLSLTIIELKGTIELQIVVWITKTAITITIPQDTIILIRENKRNADFSIILEEILVLTFHIELLTLMLS